MFVFMYSCVCLCACVYACICASVRARVCVRRKHGIMKIECTLINTELIF